MKILTLIVNILGKKVINGCLCIANKIDTKYLNTFKLFKTVKRTICT